MTPLPPLGVFAFGGSVGDFESIQTITAAGGESSLSFTSIPSTYKHLQIRAAVKRSGGSAADNTNIRFNSDTGSNYSWHQLYGEGSSALASASNSQTSIRAIHSDITANVFGLGIIDIFDYASTNKNKTTRTFAGWDDNFASTGYVIFRSGVWLSTSAITSVTMFPSSGTFAQYSTFALYGIKG